MRVRSGVIGDTVRKNPSFEEPPMRTSNTTEAVQMLDLLLEYFADGRRWTRGRFYSHGRHCLVGALNSLRCEHRVASGAARDFLEEAIRRECGRRLVYFNDRRCKSIAELRSVIVKARALALQEPERERAAAAVERWLLAEVDRERAARAAAGDTRPTYILCPRPPAELALLEIDEASLKQAA